MNSSRISRLALAGCVVVAAACHRGDKASSDSALQADLTLANQTGGEPQLQDTALRAAPAPARTITPPRAEHRSTSSERTSTPTRVTQRAPEPAPAPAPAPPPAPPPAPTGPSVAAGTAVSLTTTSRVCAGAARPGDKLVATTVEPMTASDGEVIPAGTKVVVDVANVQTSTKPEDATISFRVRAIALPTERLTPRGEVVASVPLEHVRTTSRTSDAKKVGGGAAAGAIIGQVIGKDTKGTLIGAAAGAILGGAIAAKTATYDACLPAGASLRLTLTDPMFLHQVATQ